MGELLRTLFCCLIYLSELIFVKLYYIDLHLNVDLQVIFFKLRSTNYHNLISFSIQVNTILRFLGALSKFSTMFDNLSRIRTVSINYFHDYFILFQYPQFVFQEDMETKWKNTRSGKTSRTTTETGKTIQTCIRGTLEKGIRNL